MINSTILPTGNYNTCTLAVKEYLCLYLFTGFGDLEFSMYAYVSALASVVCQSFYLTYIQKSGVEEGLSTVTVLFTNSVNCVPLLLIYTLFNKELFSALAFDGLNITGFQVCFLCCTCRKATSGLSCLKGE